MFTFEGMHYDFGGGGELVGDDLRKKFAFRHYECVILLHAIMISAAVASWSEITFNIFLFALSLRRLRNG
jgi:hypothetical protein